MIRIAVHGKVPAKSNSYRIIKLKGRCALKVADEVAAYQDMVRRAAQNVAVAEGGMPFPEGRLLLEIIWHREQYDGRHRDLDNILKALKDALNKTIWTDDRQVSDIRLRMVYDAEEEWLELFIQPDAANPMPGKRPRSRRSSAAMMRTRSTRLPGNNVSSPAKKSSCSARIKRSAVMETVEFE